MLLLVEFYSWPHNYKYNYNARDTDRHSHSDSQCHSSLIVISLIGNETHLFILAMPIVY